jgi:ankyrin repeat protein
VLRGVDKLLSGQYDKEYDTILDWLTRINYGPQQSNFISQRQAGTGQWLLDSTEFQAWLYTKKQVLFCPGVPGAGKTVLTSIVIDYLDTKFGKEPDIGIAYLYCDFRREHEQKPEDLLRNLLKQLIQERSSIPKSVRLLYDYHKKKSTRPSIDDISKALVSIISNFSKVFIIIDALDECEVNNGHRSRFVSEIVQLQTQCNANLFVTSRVIPEIVEKFEGSIMLEIRASKEDMRKYLNSDMVRLPAFVGRNPELQEEIKNGIVNAADGMYIPLYTPQEKGGTLTSSRFLLAKLNLESLTGKPSPKSIRIALKGLPTGSEVYDKAYNETMKRIKAQVLDAQELAERVLYWLTFAKRLLSISELRHALAVEVGESEIDEENLPEIEDIVSRCFGLVTVDKKSNLIRLVHYTTQDYFERTQSHWFPSAERKIATTCITYLSFDIFKGGVLAAQTEMNDGRILRLSYEYPLFPYAAQYWGYHARHSPERDILDLVLDFLEQAPRLACSVMHALTYRYGATGRRPAANAPKVQIAASFGLKGTVKALLERGADVEARSSDGWTALTSAAWNGQEAVIGLLLEHGANIEAKNNDGWTALANACRNKQLGAMRELLANGADIETRTNSRWTPLLGAAWHGHESVVRLLLQKGADTEATNNNGWTSLHQVAGHGDDILIRVLLENGARVDARSNWGWTPLMSAAIARTSDKHTIQLLLDAGSDKAARDTRAETAYDKAAQHGKMAIMHLLR